MPTTRRASAPPAPPSPQRAAPEPRNVPIADVIESKTNPRRSYNPERMKELEASVRRYGVIQPLLGRMAGKKVEIIAGTRRLRAAQKAGLQSLPVQVGAYSDEEVLELQLVENIQREDVHPLEEADGFDRLLKMGHHTAATLAEKVHREVSYIYRRLALLKLIPEVRAALFEGKISLDHGRLLSGLRAVDQGRALKEALWQRNYFMDSAGKEHSKIVACSVGHLSHWIGRNILLALKGVPWALDDVTLVAAAGSCSACPKRTGANLALFDELPDKTDRCLDRACFNQKIEAALVRIETDTGSGALVRVSTSWTHSDERRERRIKLTAGEFNTVEKGARDCPNTKNGLVALGDDLGRVFRICTDRKCKIHARSYSQHGSPSDIWREKERRLTSEIRSAARKEIIVAVLDRATAVKTMAPRICEPDLRALLLAAACQLDLDQQKELRLALGDTIQPAKGWADHWNPLKKRIQSLPAVDFPKLLVLLAMLLPYNSDDPGAPFALLAGSRKINLKALEARVGKKLREEFKQKKAAALKRAAAKKGAAK